MEMPSTSKEICFEKAVKGMPIMRDDDYRCETAYKNGGFPLNDPAIIGKYRNAFKTMLSSVGRQLITGKFNLASTSFPIQCMAPVSILQLYG
jgi:hypothetical protein